MIIRKYPVKHFTKLSLSILYLIIYRSIPDYKKPSSFYEKLMWINFNIENPLMAKCADKFTVRDYVCEKGLGNSLNDLLGVYDSPDDIDFEALPDSFVLKCTHGSGMNIICYDKASMDFKKTRKKLRNWLNINYSNMFGELHYSNIVPRIVCEGFLGEDLTDYKVYCFHGKPEYIMLCKGRASGAIKWYLYDFDWNYTRFLKKHLDDPQIPKPDNLAEIYDFCCKLSNDFIFVRVDFYNIENQIVFGELTFTPSAFMDNKTTEEMNLRMGNLIQIAD